MISIFEAESYKSFVEQLIASMPRKGRGQFSKIAEHLGLHPTRVSQIFKGELHLTADQAQSLTKFFGLSALDSEYFVTLVLRDRAETKDLRALFEGQLERMQVKSRQIINRVPRDLVMTSEQKAEFYSSWFYSAIRLATSMEGTHDVNSLSEFFGMDRARVQQVLEFLLQTGLCVIKEGRIQMGAKTTHLEQTSPLVLRHHSNWRVRALNRHEALTESELAYTCPVSLHHEDMLAVREMLSQVIEKFLKRVTASEPADTLACLNVDWFKIKA